MTAGKKAVVREPIFIVGCGRSGTTLIYEILSLHPELAWFSNLTDRFPRLPQLAVLNRSGLLRSSDRWRLRPAEGYRVWDHYSTLSRERRIGVLSKTDASSEEGRRFTRVIRLHQIFQGRPRFINKATRNTRRIGYLRALFEDARFIHVVRDPRSVVASMLRVAWWDNVQVWCENNITPSQWRSNGGDETELAARLWTAEVATAVHELGDSSGHGLQVCYEDLLAEPETALRKICDFCELDWEAPIERAVQRTAFRDRSQSFTTDLESGQIGVVESFCFPLASRLGYQKTR